MKILVLSLYIRTETSLNRVRTFGVHDWDFQLRRTEYAIEIAIRRKHGNTADVTSSDEVEDREG